MMKIGYDEKILLVQLPFWAPLIPPQGIARIKSYLKKYGYQNIRTIDANVENRFKTLYERYFDVSKKIIPIEKHGNFYDNGHDVLRYHQLAQLNCKNVDEYFEIVKILFHIHYLHDISRDDFINLSEVLKDFYIELDKYYLELIEMEQPKVVGFSLHCGTLPAILRCAELTKKWNKKTLTCLGGSYFVGEFRENSPEFKLFADKTLDTIDKIIIGQGEHIMLKLMKGEIENKRIYSQFDYPEGILNVSTFSDPNLDDFLLDKYSLIASYASISCPNQCSFCNEKTFYGEYQVRNLDKVVDDFKMLYKKYNRQLFFMLDVIMNSFLSDLTRKIQEANLPIYFDGYIRVGNAVADIKNTMTWRRGGYYRARMGLESGSQKILDIMNKGITVQQSKKALEGLAYAGIKTTGYFVVGHPGETKKDFQKTLDFISDCKDLFWQIEPHLFNYIYSGQSSETQWSRKRKPVFTNKQKNMLLLQKWILDLEPLREEALKRQLEMVDHCYKNDITNPYYVYDKYKADKRWQKLYENAVPSIVDINDGSFTDPIRTNVEKIKTNVIIEDNGGFNF